jgi:hypothetical protein
MRADLHVVGRVTFDDGDFLVLTVSVDRLLNLGCINLEEVAARLVDDTKRQLLERFKSKTAAIVKSPTDEELLHNIHNVLITLNVVGC